MAILKVSGESIASSSLAEINVITGGNDYVRVATLYDVYSVDKTDPLNPIPIYPNNNDVLQYNASTERWEYEALPNKVFTALEPGDNVSELVNDAGYITSVPAETFTLSDIKAAVAASPTYADFVTYITNL